MQSLEPFYFGSNSQLFGAYHPAEGMPSGQALLVVPPPLNDAMRAHFTMRQIAVKVAAAGTDVLRFDFAGSGNSLGDTDSVCPSQWIDNIAEASSELEDISGCDSLSIVTVRFSACLASHLGKQRKVAKFVMWDPVLSGESWLQCLRRSQEIALQRLPGAPFDPEREFLGYRMHPDFVEQLKSLEMGDLEFDQSLTIVHDEALLDQASNGKVYLEFECDWGSMSSQMLYPHDVVNNICRFLT